MDTYLCFDIYLELDHSYNKYSNLIGYWQVSMCDSHLQVLPSGSNNTKLNFLTLRWFLSDLEDLRALIEPSLRLGFYIVLWSSKSHRNLQKVSN